jgi:hypothetical protein
MDHDTREQLIRALKDLRGAADDANSIVEDMLRPPRMRQLGHILQRDNYGEARGKLVASHAFLMRCVLTEPEPSDPAGSGGAGPAH